MILAAQFPLVERELLRAGRNIHTYLARTYLTTVALVIMLLVWIANDRYELKLLDREPEMIGRYFAGLAMFFQYVVVLFIAPSIATPLIINEKEERTLPLLLLAGRHHWDIVGAKYVSVVIQVVMLILCIMPLQAIAALFGGVDVPGLVLQGVLMAFLGAVVCALGLYFSTVCKTTTAAISLVQFVLLVWFLGTQALDQAAVFTGAGGYRANLFTIVPSVAFYGSVVPAHIPALIVGAIIGVWALLRTVYILPRQVLLVPVAKVPVRRRKTKLGQRNGLVRLATAGGDGLGMNDRSVVIRIFAFIGLCALAQIPVLGCFIVMLFYLRAATRGLGRLRASGALEEMLLTPQSDRALIAALFQAALVSAAFFIVPILMGILGNPYLPAPGLRIWREHSVLAITTWIVGLVVLQVVVCAAVACFAMTISRPVQSQERYANLVYLGCVILPIVLPYLALAICAMYFRSFDVDPMTRFMFGPFTVVWPLLVPSVAGLFLYTRAVKRIRVKLAAGPPRGREHPLMALLRP